MLASPPGPKARVLAARGLMVLGILMIASSTCLGGCMLLATLGPVALHASPAVVVFLGLLYLAIGNGFGITYLICRPKILCHSRPATIVALVLASIQAGLGALGLLSAGLQRLEGTAANIAATGPEAPGEKAGYMMTTCLIYLIIALLVAALVHLIILLVKLLNE